MRVVTFEGVVENGQIKLTTTNSAVTSSLVMWSSPTTLTVEARISPTLGW